MTLVDMVSGLRTQSVVIERKLSYSCPPGQGARTHSDFLVVGQADAKERVPI